MRIEEIVAKLPKARADYGKGMGAHRCGNCLNYRRGSCAVVEGAISADAWCVMFAGRPESPI